MLHQEEEGMRTLSLSYIHDRIESPIRPTWVPDPDLVICAVIQGESSTERSYRL